MSKLCLGYELPSISLEFHHFFSLQKKKNECKSTKAFCVTYCCAPYNGEASLQIWSCYISFSMLTHCKNNRFLKKGIMLMIQHLNSRTQTCRLAILLAPYL